MHLLQRESLMLERCPERSFLVVHLFSARCCVSLGDSPVSRFSLTGAHARMSLQSLHWWNAFSQGPNIPLSFCALLPLPPSLIHGKGGGEGTLSVLLYSFTWLFYELRYFSPSVFLSPYPSWKSHLSVRKFVCSVVLEPWVIAFLVVCHYRDFCSQCVGVSEEKRA